MLTRKCVGGTYSESMFSALRRIPGIFIPRPLFPKCSQKEALTPKTMIQEAHSRPYKGTYPAGQCPSLRLDRESQVIYWICLPSGL